MGTSQGKSLHAPRCQESFQATDFRLQHRSGRVLFWGERPVMRMIDLYIINTIYSGTDNDDDHDNDSDNDDIWIMITVMTVVMLIMINQFLGW